MVIDFFTRAVTETPNFFDNRTTIHALTDDEFDALAHASGGLPTHIASFSAFEQLNDPHYAVDGRVPFSIATEIMKLAACSPATSLDFNVVDKDGASVVWIEGHASAATAQEAVELCKRYNQGRAIAH
jgi:hypothetical protein